MWCPQRCIDDIIVGELHSLRGGIGSIHIGPAMCAGQNWARFRDTKFDNIFIKWIRERRSEVEYVLRERRGNLCVHVGFIVTRQRAQFKQNIFFFFPFPVKQKEKQQTFYNGKMLSIYKSGANSTTNPHRPIIQLKSWSPYCQSCFISSPHPLFSLAGIF